ncbi:MAG: VRR-NUC domain-containing protein, partial [Treponema socranskii subsp. buccale]
VVRQVKEVIDITGLEIQRVNVGCFAVGEGRTKRFIRTAKKGTLDFEGYDNHGRHVGIECKRPVGGRLSDEQAERIDDINRKGGVAFVVTSGAEAMELLKINKCI